jgi:hypothetical protein
MSSTDDYKLYYFPVRNLGEPIRMLMNYAEQPFKDVRIPLEGWQEKWKDGRHCNYFINKHIVNLFD